EAATWLTLGSRNPVLRYDLVYRLRGFAFGLLFLGGLGLPCGIVWAATRSSPGVTPPPFWMVCLGTLYLCVPFLIMALMATPVLGLRFWRTDWGQRTAPFVLITRLTDREIMTARRHAAFALGVLPILGIAAGAWAGAAVLYFRYGQGLPAVILAAVCAWALTACWLEATAAVDPRP